jgi:hypothetical protein
MAVDLNADSVFANVIGGLPRVADLIAIVPEESRSLALAAAEESYLKTALELGYDGADAQEWASEVMKRLRADQRFGRS